MESPPPGCRCDFWACWCLLIGRRNTVASEGKQRESQHQQWVGLHARFSHRLVVVWGVCWFCALHYSKTSGLGGEVKQHRLLEVEGQRCGVWVSRSGRHLWQYLAQRCSTNISDMPCYLTKAGNLQNFVRAEEFYFAKFLLLHLQKTTVKLRNCGEGWEQQWGGMELLLASWMPGSGVSGTVRWFRVAVLPSCSE